MMRSDPAERARAVQGMFGQIAARYDLMNRLMTAGQDVRWRRLAVGRLQLAPGARLLDLATGTGDLAREALRQYPGVQVTAADFSLAMMQQGRLRDAPGAPGALAWAASDALRLPFPDASFDGVISGFLLRNVVDLDLALREQHRVLKPGGRFVTLDTTRPRPGPLLPFIRLWMRYGIPLLGQLVTGQRDAYTYLPSTSEQFLLAEDLAARIETAGFGGVGFTRLMFGTAAVHWGLKGWVNEG